MKLSMVFSGYSADIPLWPCTSTDLGGLLKGLGLLHAALLHSLRTSPLPN
jgi:hypothetical protein